MGDFKGTVQVRDTLQYTDFVFGPKSLITGKELLLIDFDGDTCDCMWSYTGIVKIDIRDIKKINHNILVNPNKYLHEMNNDETRALVQEWIAKKTIRKEE